MKKYQRARGVYDRIPQPDPQDLWKASHLWEFVFAQARNCSKLFGYEEVAFPAFENTELFSRGAGETSDIVAKEMYTFQDKGGRSITLRPECTASMVRAYIENHLFQYTRQKFFYLANCWRYDRTQRGRYREFYQFGAEVFGSSDPYLDVEVIDMVVQFLQKCGLKNYRLLINSIGNSEARNNYKKALHAFLKPHRTALSQDSQIRLDKNPLRILDSKDPADRHLLTEAPIFRDFLEQDSIRHFESVLHGLDTLGISYCIDPKLVRGLDYYNRTVFEVLSTDSEDCRQNALAAGGRYDTLVKMLGGPDTPGIGFSCGIERLLQALLVSSVTLPHQTKLSLLFIPLDEESLLPSLQLLSQTRRKGIDADLYRKNFHLKKALQFANEASVQFVAILGENERANHTIVLKNLAERTEQTVAWSSLFDFLKDNV